MMDYLGGIAGIFTAFISLDWFAISDAVSHPSAYVVGAILTLGGGYLFMRLLRAVPLLDRNLDKTLLVSIYLIIAAIIFVSVIQRFVFSVQEPWSTTLPPVLFLVMTWIGCAYNCKLRSHLSFSELRMNMPRPAQFFCLCMDAVLWLVFAIIVIVTTFRQTANSGANFQILLGTDDVMQWWFYLAVPLTWLLLSARIIENFVEDLEKYGTDEPLIEQSAIGKE